MMSAKFRAAPLLGERVGAEVKASAGDKAAAQSRFEPGRGSPKKGLSQHKCPCF